MEAPVIRSSDGDADCPWSPREAELLAVTLRAAPGTRLRPIDPRRGGHDGAREQGHALPTVADQGRTRVGRIRRGHPAGRGRPRHRHAARRSAATGRADLRSRQHPCEHHSGGARGGLPERRARRHDAGAVPRPAKSPHVARPRTGRRPRRDRGLRHHRGPLGRVARLPHLPLGPDRPCPITAAPCKTSSTTCSSPASPVTTSGGHEHLSNTRTACGVRSRTVLST